MSLNTEITNKDIITQLKMSQMLPGIEESIILRRIIHREAEQAGIQLEVQELQDAADNFRMQNRLISIKDMNEWLSKHRLSLDEFEDFIRLQLLNQKFKAIVLNKRVEQYFYQHHMEFDQVVLYEVILQSKELTTELYYALREGEVSFATIASQYIEDVELKRKGGYLGVIRRKDLSPELLSVFSLTNPPQVAKPITTGKGHHLLWVDTIIKAELNETTHQEIQSQLYMTFLKERLTQQS